MHNSRQTFDVIVIGGGASGMMAAYQAAFRGKRVLILEKNNALGEKLKITGGGRCNITNANPDTRAMLANYGKAAPFLFTPFSQFGVTETIAFFESRGLPLVVEDRFRAFPTTHKALDVFRVLEKSLSSLQVTIRTNSAVSKMNHANGQVVSVEVNGQTITAKSFILATGGMSHPETGSTGDGFHWLEDLGHTVQQPTPTIVPLAVKESWVKTLAGTSLKGAKIMFYLDGKKQFVKLGDILFTHFGLSGPTILNSSGKVAELLEAGDVTATIDMFPGEDLGALEGRILAMFDANKNKQLNTIFKTIVPPGMSVAAQSLLSTIDFDTKVHSITKDDRKKIVHTLKALPITITNLMGYDRAVVADGGIALLEMDMKTMRSKLFSNLYITGDLLHINRPSGGFSLQLCWTTGFIAGDNA